MDTSFAVAEKMASDREPKATQRVKVQKECVKMIDEGNINVPQTQGS